MNAYSEQGDSELKKRILSANPKRSHFTRRWVIVTFFLLVAAGLGFWLQSSSNSASAPKFQTAEAVKGQLSVKVTATGTLQPLDQVEMSSETSGTVKSVLVDENDSVQQGQVLLKLDTVTLEAQVKQAKANVESAKAQISQAQVNLEEKKTTYQRKSQLPPGEYMSDEELNSARSAYLRASADLTSARAQRLQAQAALSLQEDKLRKATIVSPFNGVVLSREIDPGQTVAASLQAPVLFTLARDLTQMELRLYIDEADIGRVQKGQHARFTVDAFPDHQFEATITKVHLAPETVEGVITYQARLHVNNPDGLLRPGMTSTADIVVVEIDQALLIPNSALRFVPPQTSGKSSRSVVSNLIPRRPREAKKPRTTQGKEAQVWTLENNQPKALQIQTGLTDGVYTQVLKGLQPGQPVIIDTLDGNP